MLDKLGFTLVGYGCTTCIGNSGPLPDAVANAITDADLVAAAVISGNRNFEGRVHPQVRANYLASPMLVVAYALAGSINLDLTKEPLGYDKKNEPVYLKDIWPQPKEIADTIRKSVKACVFRARYGNVFDGDANWKKVKVSKGQTYQWDIGFDLCEEPALFRRHDRSSPRRSPTSRARASWRCSAIPSPPITFRRPARSRPTAPAGVYLQEQQIAPAGFQFLWLAARQSRSDGARHLRQYPHPQRDDGRQGRRQHDPLSLGRGSDVDLRRGRSATRKKACPPS